MAAPARSKFSRSFGGNTVIIIFLSLIGVLMVLPFVYAVLQSLKPIEEIYIFPPHFWVTRPTLQNFSDLFHVTSDMWVPFFRYVFNSMFVSVACTVLQVVFASMAAYPLAKHNFRGKNIVFNLIVISLLFSGEVVFLPQYMMITVMGFMDSYFALILPVVAYPLGLYLMRQNMLGFPDSVIEAARIDGAPEWFLFWHIVMPNMKPVWMTMIVFSFGTIWSKSDTSYIYSEQLKALPTLLNQLAASGVARAGVGAAATVLLMVPPIIIFLVTQKNVIETMTNSGLKE